MDRWHLIKGVTMMIIIVNVTSQHFPPSSSQHPFDTHFSLLDDDSNGNGNRDWNFFKTFQKPQQKPIKLTGNILTPAKITFDTNSALLPQQMINRLKMQNIYWTLTRQQLQQQEQQSQRQQQQKQQHPQQQDNFNHFSYQKPIFLQQRKSRSIGRMMQSRQRQHLNSQGKTNNFDPDLLQPHMEESTILHDEVLRYLNKKEPLLPPTLLLLQLWWNAAKVNAAASQNIFQKNTHDYNSRFGPRLSDALALYQSLLSTKHKRTPSKIQFAFEPDGPLDYDDDNDDIERSLLDEVDLPLALPLFMPLSLEHMPTSSDDAFFKRNAFRNHKRQKLRTQTRERFIPSISAGAMTNLGHFFKDLKSNVQFMEKQRLSPSEAKLLEGDHPINMLHDELMHTGEGRPTDGTAAFLHAIRTYRPSQRIRSLVAMNPEGYHGSQFLDPNYMWVGLGK